MELGVYSFGNTPRVGDGYGATAQAIRDALEAVKLAEEVGLDFFGFGEHHTRSMPLSSPTAMVNAAAAATERIGLGTTVTVLSTDEPIRVFEQLATAADRGANYGPDGMVFVGGPNEMAERILNLHQLLGHSRQIFQMDVGGMPHATFLRAIELLGAEVLPQVRKELGPHGITPSETAAN
jgi:alkanesulfonate monooxygenase SsuD/methylene tetrahydromethanopterin reductase-like flavin-dependent oxidoreductase (luciferase family)